MQVADIQNVQLPANWNMNQPVIPNCPNTYTELEKRIHNQNDTNNGINWYLEFKEQGNSGYVEPKMILDEAIFDEEKEEYMAEDKMRLTAEQNEYIKKQVASKNVRNPNNLYERFYK